MLPLIGVAIVVAGFLLRFNPLVTVLAAAGASGLAAGLSPVKVVEAFGHAFNENRYVSAVWLVLPLIGLLERYGLQERARTLVGGARRATAGRLLMLYFVFRQATAAIGLTSVGGHAQMVRPLVAPMAEGAAEARDPQLAEPLRRLVRAYAAATDNIAVFFGEDIFIAMSSILLIRGVLQGAGVSVEPLQLSVWAIPTAGAALAIHAVRMWRLDRRLEAAREPSKRAGAEAEGSA